ncbi:MerR family transcriptional regulator [Micromonospora sp. WMMA1363]|uniref:MerR family transcriptional regulator n=1 Tax=Micromonospora sp. WMMA1363 TaxID=3053985 RepID=UPI00259C9E28|nr:MerR family transcriptional regulator [Micromonospora sp. WMMA1363]MDM4718742.1 MerR family transcriptional regulator [Micromonospora sp. WMMA1363]
MERLTIGSSARAAGLTPKALRLYDGTGLLPPAAVDGESGYRFYAPDQLDRARLIATLRRVGMPLVEIGRVGELPPAAAAEAIVAYRRTVATDAVTRSRAATHLVDFLSGRDSTMTDPNHALGLRYAVRCETGAVRDSNEDAAYASGRLLAVADGMRGPGGATASAAAVDALRPLEFAEVPATELLALLADAVVDADRAVRRAGTGDHQPVTTLTALLRSGDRFALVHVGDTRAYLRRDGELSQLTSDHTYVQSLVDQGRLGADAVASHPRRALLVRALGAGPDVEVDLALRTAHVGDRYLLLGRLSAVADRAELSAVLSADADPEQAVDRLTELAHAHGAPDNIACVVADVVAA